MVAGSKRFCTAINGVLKGKAVVKTGAEGVMMAAIPTKGFGIALKIDDGAARANGVALAAVLSYLGVMEAEEAKAIAEYINVPIKDFNGRLIGHVRAALDWPPESKP